jgi:hypothetical protein
MIPNCNPNTDTEVASALGEFNHSCIVLAKLLQSGVNLTDEERLSLENHLAVVQLNYAVWTRQCQRS